MRSCARSAGARPPAGEAAGPRALETRRAYDAAARNDLQAQLQYEAERQGDSIDRPEFEEGVRAFLEKREPDFTRLGARGT
jgi:enoyl-CoA hydratase/carnithine racemase